MTYDVSSGTLNSTNSTHSLSEKLDGETECNEKYDKVYVIVLLLPTSVHSGRGSCDSGVPRLVRTERGIVVSC